MINNVKILEGECSEDLERELNLEIQKSGQKIKDIQFRVSLRMSAGYSNSVIYYAMIIFGE